MADINAIAEQIQGLTLLEASQLVKLLEEKLGVSAAAAAPVAAAGGGGGGAASGVGEKNQCHQGCARSHQPRLERSQRSRRRRAEACEGRRQQGRGRGNQEEVRRRRCICRSEVTSKVTTRAIIQPRPFGENSGGEGANALLPLLKLYC